MSKKFEFKKCKMCQATRHEESNHRSGLEFMVDGKFYCLTCLEKKRVNCRWCRKNINPARDCSQYVYDGGGIFGGEVNTSTICCSECLHKFEYEKDEWGHDKRIESDRWKKCQKPGCEYIISCHEEAIGYDKWCRSCVQEKKDQEWREKNKATEQDFEKYKQFQAKAQSWWSALSPHEREQECERVVENMKQEKYWTNNVREGEGSGWACDGSLWILKNGKFTSSSPHLVPIQIVEEFSEKEIGFRDNKAIEWFDSQVVKVKKDDSDNPPLKIEEGERISEKKLKIIDNNKSNNETLVIELKRIKKITLRNDSKLEIEFNSVQNNQNASNGYLINQIMTNEQVDNNQELQKVRSYLQKNNKISLNQRELTEFFNSSSVPTETPKDISRLLKIGGGAVLVFGLLGWLLVVSKRKLKKH